MLVEYLQAESRVPHSGSVCWKQEDRWQENILWAAEKTQMIRHEDLDKMTTHSHMPNGIS